VKVFANSVQKSGTHLLLRLLEELGLPRYRRWRIDPEWTLERSIGKRLLMRAAGLGDPVPIGLDVALSSWWVERLIRRMPDDSALLGHCGHSPEISGWLTRLGVKTVCVVRDPRDVVVSYAHFVMRIGKSKITRKPVHQALVGLPDHGARLLAMIDGIAGWAPVPQRFREFLGWCGHPDVLFVRFEDLVGAAGGGDDGAQRLAVAEVASHLELARTPEELDGIRSRLFGGTATFRKGTLGQWREEFDARHRDAARRSMGELLVALGYESSTDWD
jgi:hypothetical protein